MYCVRCGVKLADSEERCPLCGTRVYHPDITREAGESLYPKAKYPTMRVNSKWVQIVLTALSILPALIVLVCDIQYGGGITWSGYVIGALMLGYVMFILPTWFKQPNPVIFVPCDFAAIILYLLYVDCMTGGGWFLSFAFPIAGGVGLIVTAVVTLLRYVRRGGFFIMGGAFVAMGGLTVLMEWLMSVTFQNIQFIGWSFHPLIVLGVLGGALIFLGISRPARESMERIFFL